MNKSYRNIIGIVITVCICSIFFYWAPLDFRFVLFGNIGMIIIGIYAIYQNLKALIKERKAK